jgi:hypothetical protein
MPTSQPPPDPLLERIELFRDEFDAIIDQAIRDLRTSFAALGPSPSTRDRPTVEPVCDQLNPGPLSLSSLRRLSREGLNSERMAELDPELLQPLQAPSSLDPETGPLDSVGDRLSAISRRLESSLKRSRPRPRNEEQTGQPPRCT